jgi:hypothetical protein
MTKLGFWSVFGTGNDTPTSWELHWSQGAEDAAGKLLESALKPKKRDLLNFGQGAT